MDHDTLRGCASGARLAGHSSALRVAARAGSTSCSHACPARWTSRGRGLSDLVASGRERAAAAWRARAPSARPRRARVARRRGRRWRCGDRAAGVRVGVDGRSLVGGGARGVAHYTGALLEALAAAFPDDEYRVLLPRGQSGGPARGRAGPPPPPRPRAVRRRGAGRRARPLPPCSPAPTSSGPPRPLHWRSAMRRSCSPSTTARGSSGRGDFTPYERAWHAAARPRRLARRAARVLTDTAAVRADLIRAWGLAADRVRAVPLRPAEVPAGGRRPALLVPVRRRARAAQGAGPPGRRVPPRPDARARGRARGGRGRPARPARAGACGGLGRVDDLDALYAGALAVVLPSWLEGFGLPPVEGLAAGAPAIVSDLPVLREVLGDGALVRAAGRRRGARRRAALARARPGAPRPPARRRPRQDRPPHLGRDRAARPAPCWRRRHDAAFSVVVVLHDSAGPLPALLASLGRLPAAPQLIVVDTASSDDGPALARAAGAEVVELGDNPGFGAANNAGVERAGAPGHRPAQPGLRAARRLARPARRAREPTAGCGSRGCSTRTARSSARRTRCRARSARCSPRSCTRRLLPRRAARARRAVPRRSGRAASAGRSRPAWPPRTETLRRLGPFDPGQFLFYRGHGPLPARPRRRDPHGVRPGGPRPPPRRPLDARPSYDGEPHELLAQRRREVVGANRGAPRCALDDLAQALTFATRAAGRRVLGRRRRTASVPSSAPCCAPGHNDAVSIRQLKASDRDAFLEMVHSSRDLHRPWAYPPERADQFDELLSRCSRDDFACFIVIDDDTGGIAGVFNISQIVRGSFQSAFLGYYGSARYAGKGLMRARPPAGARLRLRPALAAPDRGEHPARQRRLDRAGARRRLPPRGLLAALPADRRPVARPRALRAHGRRARCATAPTPYETRSGSGSGAASISSTSSGSSTTGSGSGGSGCGRRVEREQLRQAGEVGPQRVEQRARVERGGRVVDRVQPHGARADRRGPPRGRGGA